MHTGCKDQGMSNRGVWSKSRALWATASWLAAVPWSDRRHGETWYSGLASASWQGNAGLQGVKITLNPCQ